MPYDDVSVYFDPASITENTRRTNAELIAHMATLPISATLVEARLAFAEGRAGIPASPKSPTARKLEIAGPSSSIGLRILVPDEVRGAYLHIHGGGWRVGTNDMWDARLERLGREAGLVCISVEYRLAPEHVFPAALDDCVEAAVWLIKNSKAEFNTSNLTIGGESAGAHLSVLTLLRLRDQGYSGAFDAANLLYGCYDLSLTPSVRRSHGTPVIDRASIEDMIACFRGQLDSRDPAISPLYADLTGLPPALFSVGTLDPLIDDTLFLHRRWQAAGINAQIKIYPGGIHGFDVLRSNLAESAHINCTRFLRSNIDSTV